MYPLSVKGCSLKYKHLNHNTWCCSDFSLTDFMVLQDDNTASKGPPLLQSRESPWRPMLMRDMTLSAGLMYDWQGAHHPTFNMLRSSILNNACKTHWLNKKVMFYDHLTIREQKQITRYSCKFIMQYISEVHHMLKRVRWLEK